MRRINNIHQKLRTLQNVRMRFDESDFAFIDHNIKMWGQNSYNDKPSEILIEFCSVASTIISFSYFSNVLAKKYRANITAYWFNKDFFATKIKKRNLKKIFSSFGVTNYIYPHLNKYQKVEQKEIVNSICKKITNKQEIETLTINRLWVGDLIYDSHLRNYKVPTIDIQSKLFAKTINDAVRMFIFWRDYLDANNVRAIVVSHSVYIPAIIVRLAVSLGIPCYQVNATHVYYLNRSHIMAYNEHFDYPEEFEQLPRETRQEGLKEAKKRLNLRFSGEVGVDMLYSTKSAYANNNNGRILSQNNKIKILIAAHCFFDAPHPYGLNLFPDFYEWLSFLGYISEKTEYEWYIKTHPDYLPGNIPIIHSFLKKYPKFQFIPSDTSHLQLINEGINFALSVYGTIGFEYAALGVPVIYASKCNPCIAYNFNIHPQSIDEYKKILMDLHNCQLNINQDKVYEFYFMRFIHNTKNWLFNNYAEFIKKIGGHAKQAGSISYRQFLTEMNQEKHNRILLSLSKFIESEEYYFQKRHMINQISPNEIVSDIQKGFKL